MAQKISREQLIELLTEALSANPSYQFIEGTNPVRILFEGKEYVIYIKNLSPAYFENPDVWRVQLPQKDEFEQHKESEVPFILLGYDAENDIYTTWNPHWVKQRLNIAKSVSFYSRLSLQESVSQTQQFKKQSLANEGEVLAFPRKFIASFLQNTDEYFTDDSDYVAMGSKKRSTANEAYKRFCETKNLKGFAQNLEQAGIAPYSTNLYCRVISSLIRDGYVSRNRKVFLACDYLEEYLNVVDTFAEIPEVKTINEKWNYAIPVALRLYIKFLLLDAEEATNEAVSLPTHDSELDLFEYGPEQSESNEFVAAESQDWEEGYIDANGKLTKITNPNLLEQLRPCMTAEYSSMSEAFRIVYSFYGDRFETMELKDWQKLINQINWKKLDDSITEPYSEQETSSRTKIRVTFPDGTIIHENLVYKTLIAVVEFAGIERVRTLNIICCGDNLITKRVNPRYKKATKSLRDGWYINTCSSTPSKYAQILEINQRFQLGLIVEQV